MRLKAFAIAATCWLGALAPAIAAPSATLTIKLPPVVAGPGTCVEIHSRPLTLPSDAFYYALNKSDAGLAAVNALCTNGGGTAQTSPCATANVTYSCQILMSNAQIMLFAYTGSPSVGEVSAACGGGNAGSGGGAARGGGETAITPTGKLLTACLHN